MHILTHTTHTCIVTYTQEHFYHVLEKNRVPCKDKVIPRDPDAPELPPPFKSGSPSPDPPPIYHDITEISKRPDERIDRDKTDQCYQKSPDLNAVGGNMNYAILQNEMVVVFSQTDVYMWHADLVIFSL